MITLKKQLNPVVVDTTKSAYAMLRPVSISAVRLTDKFWQSYREINRTVMLPAQYRLCEETGRIDNFRRAAGKINGPFKGMFFNDSDVYKWLEAAAWVLATGEDADLKSLVDQVIDEIADAQQPDGYLNTYFMLERADQRWTNFDLHEMYCAGHLFQAAIAYGRSLGNSKLMDVSIRLANYLYDRFGREEDGKVFGLDGHPEIEMALVELYRMTGEQKFLDLAQYFVDVRGLERLPASSAGRESSYYQDRIPFRQMKRLEGHSVRAVYLNCGSADLFAETGEKSLKAALDNMWESMVARQMYVTGGLGSRYEIEGFGQDYELPNGRAHTETCASIANFMWNWRMLLLDGRGRYADLMEQVLYNGILPGVSLDGESYYYQNPLSDDGSHRRERWFTVACCPANLSRLLASLPGYLYSTRENELWVHLFAENQVSVELPSGQKVDLTQRTEYPRSGEVHLTVETAAAFNLYMRLPGWAGDQFSVRLNGKPVICERTLGNYLLFQRDWLPGDEIVLDLPMNVREIQCNPLVVENQEKVALMRGPVLYCLENVDQDSNDVRLFSLPVGADFKADYRADLLGGVVALETTGKKRMLNANWEWGLYQPYGSGQKLHLQPVEITAVPYYAWANRTPGAMVVWIKRDGG